MHMWHYAPPAQALELEPEWPGQRLRVAMWQVVLAKKVYKEAMAERFETWIPVGVTWCTKYHEFQWQSTIFQLLLPMLPQELLILVRC